MKLLFLIGDAAVGKMTVGQELMKITDLKLFHNLICLCLASVHLPHPFHLVFGFQLFGHTVLLCQ